MTSFHIKLVALLLIALCSAAQRAVAEVHEEGSLTQQKQAIQDRVDGLAGGFTTSPDLASRILFSVDMDLDGSNALVTRFVVPLATLTDMSRGSTDPLVLELLIWRCTIEDAACDRLDLARRLVQADSQNQVAWITLATFQKRAGDPEGARATMVRASQASVWHDYFDDAVRRVSRNLPHDLTAPERLAALDMIMAKAGVLIGFAAIHTVGDTCKQDGPSREACLRIIDAMSRDGNLIALVVAPAFAARAAASSATMAFYQQKADAIYWAATHTGPTAKDPRNEVETGDSPATSAALATLEARVTYGERVAAERNLVADHLSEPEAARRTGATLSPYQIGRRIEQQHIRDAREAELRSKG